MWVLTLSNYDGSARLISRVCLSVHADEASAIREVKRYATEKAGEQEVHHYGRFSHIKYAERHCSEIGAEFVPVKP